MDCVVINGYFPSLTIKSVLNTITEEILGTEDTFSSNTEHVAHILRYVEPEPLGFCRSGTRTKMPSGFGTGIWIRIHHKRNTKSKMRGQLSEKTIPGSAFNIKRRDFVKKIIL
jgi:hypothetical protein